MIDDRLKSVKVNNEIDLCEVIARKQSQADQIRHKIEASMQYARVSYFLRWQEPGLFARIFKGDRTTVVFCVNSAQLEDAMQVLADLELTDQEIRLLGTKSRNRYVYAK